MVAYVFVSDKRSAENYRTEITAKSLLTVSLTECQGNISVGATQWLSG